MTNPTHYSLYVLGAALLTACVLVLSEIAIQFYHISPFLVVVLANFSGGVVMLLASTRTRRRWRGNWRQRDWGLLLIAAMLIYIAGFLLSFNAVGLIGAGKAALLGQLETPFVVILAIIFLGERLSLRRWLAGGLALSGSILINFDWQALELSLGWGEVLAFLAPLSFASGIILLKPLLDKAEAGWLTGLALLFGSLLSLPAAPFFLSSLEFSSVIVLIVMAIGLLRGGAWLGYNLALRHIGPAHCAILFVSFAFFTVILQIIVANLAPALGLQLPDNLPIALLGGGLVAVGIIILHTEPKSAPLDAAVV
jgi:drug/metabolite transporter (DMT)-like permease